MDGFRHLPGALLVRAAADERSGLVNGLAGNGVRQLCEWWARQPETAGSKPDHIGVYIPVSGLWRSMLLDDPTLRTLDDFSEGRSTAVCGRVLIEFRRALEEKGQPTLVLDMSCRAVESGDASRSTFLDWSSQALARVSSRPARPHGRGGVAYAFFENMPAADLGRGSSGDRLDPAQP